MPIRYRSIEAIDLEDWYDHVGAVFAKDGRQYFVNHYCNDPWSFLAGILVAEDTDAVGSNGRPLIVSTVRVFDRRIWIRGREVHIGGIGEVSTKPEYRRQGHSGRLLTMASELMTRRGMPLSLLFTDNFRHYGRYDWRQIRLPLIAAAPRTMSAASQAGIGLRPIDLDNDLNLLMAAYDDFNRGLNGAVVRDDRAYWDRWVRCEIGDQGRVFLHAGQPVGFGRFGRREQVVGILDLGILAQHAALLPAFLHAVAAEAGLPLRTHAALYTQYQAAMDARFTVTTVEPVEDQMFKLIDGAGFLRAVYEGADSSLPDGTGVTLAYESGATTISSAAGRLTVADATDAATADSIALTDAQLLGLVLVGWERLQEVGIWQPSVTTAAATALQAVFTPSGWLFWVTDGF